jgi:ABC-type dipeptide/oligopeptide/nickel transport system permease component
MHRYIFRRIGQAILSLFLLSIIIFAVVRLTGDPLTLLLNDQATDEDRAKLREALGLDKPWPAQYWIFASNFLTGDFGNSIRGGTPVEDLVASRVFASLKLAGAAILFVLAIAIPLGIITAVKKGTPVDTSGRFIAVFAQSAPSFWVGIILIQIFSVNLGLLPTSGTGGIDHYVLPAFTLSLFVIAGVMRLLRSSMLEVLDAEYIKLARIKGVPEWKVVIKHSLRNALIPVVTFGGTYVATFVTFGILAEVVFAWPGLGRLLFEGIVFRDFPLIQALVLLAGALVITANLVVDILYAYIDPRIRYQ